MNEVRLAYYYTALDGCRCCENAIVSQFKAQRVHVMTAG
jgi:hypothetical protein